MLIPFTGIIRKEHPAPSDSHALHFLRFPWSTRLNGMGFLFPDQLPFILILDILSDESAHLKVVEEREWLQFFSTG